MHILEDLEYQAKEFGFYSNSHMTSSEWRERAISDSDRDEKAVRDER